MPDLSFIGVMMIPFIVMVKFDNELYMFEHYMKPMLESLMEGRIKHEHECGHS